MVFQLNGHTDFVRCLTMISGDSFLLLSGSDDHTIRIWDLNSLECIKVINNAHNGSVKSLIILPNESIASCSDDMSIRVWNYESGELLIDKQNAHSDEINFLVNLPNNRFASGSLDKTIKIWNSSNLDLLHTINLISSTGESRYNES